MIGEQPLERDNEHNHETQATPVVDAFAAACTVGVAVICWVVAVHEMDGMNMGVATTLGPNARISRPRVETTAG